jgi:two-component system phosphate regulon response regulator PhoB
LRGRFARPGRAKYRSLALRNIALRFDGSIELARTLQAAEHELPLPAGESVADGEWVLAVFELGDVTPARSTAAAARGTHRDAGAPAVLSFEPRDWERLCAFAEAGTMRQVANTLVDVPGGRSPAGRAADVPGGRSPAGRAADVPGGRSPAGHAADAHAACPSRQADSSRGSQAPSFEHWRASDPFTQGPHARVLVVDDDRDIRDVVGAMLDAVGLTVDSVPSAEEALERLRAQAFDLVVLDWNLPGITGIELCRLLRRDPLLYALPVLFLTAHASSRDVVDAFASGADDYVVKPFRAPELGARIFGLLRRARMSQATPP